MILIDSRVGSNHLVEPLRRRLHCDIELAHLESADVAFEGFGPALAAKDGGNMLRIGIELKVLGDMLGSMRSERFAGSQLVRMSEDYDISILIIQGHWQPGESGQLLTLTRNGWKVMDLSKGSSVSNCFQYAELFKHVLSLSLIKGLIVLRSSTELETVWQIADTYTWFQKPWEDHQSTDAIKLQSEVTFGKISLLRKMAAEIPSIGWVRSAAVEKAFLSVSHMTNASEQTWMTIEGIGPTLARKIWIALHEEK